MVSRIGVKGAPAHRHCDREVPDAVRCFVCRQSLELEPELQPDRPGRLAPVLPQPPPRLQFVGAKARLGK